MKHIKIVSAQLPAKASAKGSSKSCGPLKDFLGLCSN
jgi:hypothetical protein